jgi:hypothetical protein
MPPLRERLEDIDDLVIDAGDCSCGPRVANTRESGRAAARE